MRSDDECTELVMSSGLLIPPETVKSIFGQQAAFRKFFVELAKESLFCAKDNSKMTATSLRDIIVSCYVIIILSEMLKIMPMEE